MNDVTVFERAGFGFIGVANQIGWLTGVSVDEAPFHAAREPGPASTT